ncbi:MAG: carbonic anhydrase [Anaerolineaceae bacterium]|nr:carbonic anhydrase [Anaerolineaceae bacterium]
MSTLDMLMQRNTNFVQQHFIPDQSLMPILRTMVISCVDPRVDPAHLLGLAPGEAVVIRNIGGRITPDTLQTMGMLQTIAQIEGINPSGIFNLIVLHHTDCGITRLEEKPEILAPYFGIDDSGVAFKAISDPYAAVEYDVAALKAMGILPSMWMISGLVYDVHTGLVETVVSPDPVE